MALQMYDSAIQACLDEVLVKKIARETGYKQQKFVHFVRDAVYAVAYALHDIFVERCGSNFQGMCEAMEHIDGATLTKYLVSVTFKGQCYIRI